MAQLFANNASSRLLTGISNSALSLTVLSGEGAKFPNPTGGDFFLVTLSKVTGGIETAIEIVKVTARATDVFTIVRAQEGTTGLAYATDDFVSLRHTAGLLTAIETHRNDTANPHATTKAQVGLGSVDNTADTAKPVSTAQQTALNLKANIASPTFTGTVGGITAAMVGAPSGSGTSSGTNTGDQTITLTGEVTGTGTGSFAATVANSAVIAKILTGYVSGAGTVAAGDNILQAIQKLNGNDGLKANINNPTFTGTVGGITAAMVGAPSGSGTSSGTNTGDQTITLTGGVTGSGTGSFAATVVTNANLTGEVTSTGNATTVTNAAVIGKVITGYASGAGTVAATDTILQAINKLNGNDALKAPINNPTFTGVATLPAGSSAPGILGSTSATVTAAGTTQGTATALAGDVNVVTTSTAGTGLGVVFPSSAAGKCVLVVNRSANAISVYPALGHQFDSAGTNVPVSLPIGGFFEAFGSSATQWHGTNNAIVNGAYVVGNIAGNAATVTTNANLTGHITSSGNATLLGSFTLAQLNTAVNDADVAPIASPVFTGNVTGLGVATGTSFNSITGLSATLPVVAGTATIGGGTTAARHDHVHPAQTSVSGNAGTVTNATLTTALTVNTGTVTIAGNVANTSALTLGAGASSVSGSNTGDNATNSQYSGLVTNANHTGDVTGSAALTIAANAVTNAKAAQMAVNTIKGRITAGTGNPEDLTAANVRTILNVADGANNYVHTTNANLTGHITSVGNAAVLGSFTVAQLNTAISDADVATGGGTATGSNTGDNAVNSLYSGLAASKQDVSGKDASGGYAGLTLFKLNLRNALNTITSGFTTAATVARTWTMPDKDGTVAMTSDITGTNSGTNTGDNAVNTLYSGLVTNANHTGDATGSGALTVVRINGTQLSALGTGLLKNTTGTGVPSIGVAGTDFQAPIGTISGLVKGNGANALAAVVSGTDIKTVNSTSLLGSGNLAVGDVTLSGTQTLTNKTITDTVYAVSGSTPALAATNGGVQTWTLAGASTPTNSLTSGQSIILVITPGAHSITWPSVTWTKVGGSGTLPTLFSAGKTTVVLWMVGSTLYGSHLGDTV